MDGIEILLGSDWWELFDKGPIELKAEKETSEPRKSSILSDK